MGPVLVPTVAPFVFPGLGRLTLYNFTDSNSVSQSPFGHHQIVPYISMLVVYAARRAPVQHKHTPAESAN